MEVGLSERSDRVAAEIEDSLVTLLNLPEGTHLLDVHLAPGSLGCLVAEQKVNGVNVVVIDELQPSAQAGLQEGDIVVRVA